MNIPLSFSMNTLPLGWSDIVWAYHKHILTWKDVVKYADQKVLSGDFNDGEVAISLLGKENIEEIVEAADKLAELSGGGTEVAKRKWLFISLSWLFSNKDTIDDPLALVEDIYEDFDYPPEIQAFVRYMPPTDGYDPRNYSPNENKERLMRLWEGFLKTPPEIR